jgi:hypothetical protein
MIVLTNLATTSKNTGTQLQHTPLDAVTLGCSCHLFRLNRSVNSKWAIFGVVPLLCHCCATAALSERYDTCHVISHHKHFVLLHWYFLLIVVTHHHLYGSFVQYIICFIVCFSFSNFSYFCLCVFRYAGAVFVIGS